MNKLDHFFGSVASLMSILLRRCVQASIEDLVSFVEEYDSGNAYDGTYTMTSSLALPSRGHPVSLFLVSVLVALARGRKTVVVRR